MLSFSEKIKLTLFKIIRKSYKKRLFSSSAQNIELNLVSYLLKEEKLFFIDVGANKGEFIYAAEKSLAPDKIWAFEPLPYFAQKLKSLFPNITVFNTALSDKEMRTTLYLPVNNGIPDDSLSSVIKPAGENFLSYEIQCTTLDLVKEKNNLAEPVFLKIDVEGHEFSVLKGAENTLRNVSVMLIEIIKQNHIEKTLPEMVAEIENKDFVCYYLHPDKARLVRFSEYPTVSQNPKDLNTKNYIDNFWFFAKHFSYENVVTKLNQSIK